MCGSQCKIYFLLWIVVKKKNKLKNRSVFIKLHGWVIWILCLCLFTSQSQSTVSASATPWKLLLIISPMSFSLSDLMYPSSGTLVVEFSAMLNTAHTSLRLALPLGSMTSLSNDSPAFSTVFLSRFWSLVSLPQPFSEILTFLQIRLWALYIPHTLRLRFIPATHHLWY